MDIMKQCIHCEEKEIEPIKIDNKITYFHCFNCNTSYTYEEVENYFKLSAAQKVCFRYNHALKKHDII